ncbi:hypothetical protein DXG03_000505 [Asterophora parasitica]|uniref:Uncharacterized protein n=1 Tax=Asterophora parasitica TaxID=117018 RepID=A0A9P7G4F3_9AGAR|nr:hypothetical protein DXG03_000505 [Asterophora parasitica]
MKDDRTACGSPLSPCEAAQKATQVLPHPASPAAPMPPCPPSPRDLLSQPSSTQKTPKTLTVPLPLPLTKKYRTHAEAMLIYFAENRLLTKDTACARYAPVSDFWPDGNLEVLLDNLHVLKHSIFYSEIGDIYATTATHSSCSLKDSMLTNMDSQVADEEDEYPPPAFAND